MARIVSKLLSLFHPVTSRGVSVKQSSFEKDQKSSRHGQARSRIPTARSLLRPRAFSPLSIVSLSSLSILFLLVLGLLVFLYRYVAAKDGLSPFSQNHYVLAYIPTAIMVVIVAFWRQIDHHCKILMPWDELYQGRAHASKSIFLDYLSDLQITSWVRAIKHRHLAVALSISGFVLLKIVTIVSTGLIVLSATQLEMNTTVAQLSLFDGQLYNRFNTQSVYDEGPVYTAYGVFAKGLQPPFGTSATVAYETFSDPHYLPANTTYTVGVLGLIPSISCQPVSLDLQVDTTSQQQDTLSVSYQLVSPCNLTLPRVLSSTIQVLNPNITRTPSRQLSGSLEHYTNHDLEDCSPLVASMTKSNPAWHLLVLAEVQYNQTVNGSAEVFQPLSWSFRVTNVSSLLCQSSYEIQNVTISHQKGAVSLNQSGSFQSFGTSQQLEHFNNSDLGYMLDQAFEASINMFGSPFNYGGQPVQEVPNVLFKSMAAVGGGSYEALISNNSLMAQTAETVFQHIAVQAMSKYLRKSTGNIIIPAMLDFEERRLFISEESLWFMMASFGVTTVLAMALLFVKPKLRGLQIPEDVGLIGLTLSRSLSMQHLLNAWNGSKTSSNMLEDYRYSLGVDPSGENLSIEIARCASGMQSEPTKEALWSNMDWRPLTLRSPVLAFTLLLPVFLIALLEGLQHLSDQKNGIASVASSQQILQNLYSHYLPALVMFLTATMFNSLDFNVLVLTPFHTFSKSSLPAKYFQSTSLIGKPPPTALWRCLRYGWLAATTSSLAAFIGSLLTIVVSGLYTIDRHSSPLGMNLQILDTIHSEWSNSTANDHGAAIMSSLIENLDLSYPNFTYDELAFSRLDVKVDHLSFNKSYEAQLLTVSTSAFRASLECVPLNMSTYTVEVEENQVIKSITFNGTHSLPSTCQLGGQNGTGSDINFVYTFPISLSANDTYIGKLLDLHVGPYVRFQDTAAGSDDGDLDIPDNPTGFGCPSLAFIYGYVPLGANTNASTTVAADICFQQLQQIQTNVTLNYPDLSISAETPPIVDEHSVSYITINNTLTKQAIDPLVAMQYRIQASIVNGLATFDTANNSATSNNSGTDSGSSHNPLIANSGGGSGAFPAVDQFFQTVLYGRKPMALSHFNLATQEDRDAVMAGILSFYRRYMAQAISANLRSPLGPASSDGLTAPTSNNSILSAVLPTGATSSRLVQHKIPKIVLQALLGFMFICGCITLLTCRLRGLVPVNPCTIIGKLALWNGSDCVTHNGTEKGMWAKQAFHAAMLDPMDSDHEGQKAIENAVQFKLGWWDISQTSGVDLGSSDSESVRRYGFDIVDKEYDEI